MSGYLYISIIIIITFIIIIIIERFLLEIKDYFPEPELARSQLVGRCVQYFISIILQYYNSGRHHHHQDNTIIQIYGKYSQFHWKYFRPAEMF